MAGSDTASTRRRDGAAESARSRSAGTAPAGGRSGRPASGSARAALPPPQRTVYDGRPKWRIVFFVLGAALAIAVVVGGILVITQPKLLRQFTATDRIEFQKQADRFADELNGLQEAVSPAELPYEDWDTVDEVIGPRVEEMRTTQEEMKRLAGEVSDPAAREVADRMVLAAADLIDETAVLAEAMKTGEQAAVLRATATFSGAADDYNAAVQDWNGRT
jgi:hypothetical protein